uniref:Uncharacterized protein n=1 Tax=Rhizophora mucronata TaxID=61149 RepID=A0A2P2P7D9_RHIMU
MGIYLSLFLMPSFLETTEAELYPLLLYIVM